MKFVPFVKANEMGIVLVTQAQETRLKTVHCSQERITNPQKHCHVKPKWFLDLWTYFEHDHVDEFW